MCVCVRKSQRLSSPTITSCTHVMCVCLDYKLYKGKRVATLLRLASYVEHSLRGCISVTQKVFMD